MRIKTVLENLEFGDSFFLTEFPDEWEVEYRKTDPLKNSGRFNTCAVDGAGKVVGRTSYSDSKEVWTEAA
jgi:hypothetical protein